MALETFMQRLTQVIGSSAQRTVGLSAAILSVAVALSACAPAPQTTQATGQTGGAADPLTENRKQIPRASLTGGGASFPAPLYQSWFTQLSRIVPNLQVNYQSTGSGAGVEKFLSKTVDFGASDVAMTDEEIAQARQTRGVMLLPMTAGSIVVAFNLPGVTELKLPRDVYSGIFLGEIRTWNDPRIAEANPGVTLPDRPITVVHRADGSGTTGVFTMHLSAINENWKNTIGEGRSVEWPTTGSFIGARGNEGVTAQIQKNQGSIGYVEFGFAKSNNLAVAALQNKSGNFIVPTPESGAASLAAVELPEDMRAFIADPEGADSYPLVTYTWMLVYEKYDDPARAIGMEGMIEYGLNEGQEQADPLGYIPLPPNVRQKVAEAADRITPDYKIQVK